MEGNASLIEAKEIMGFNFIGIDELFLIQDKFPILISESVPEIPFSKNELSIKKNDYLLILGLSTLNNGMDLNIRSMLELFGIDPTVSEPCFYNQDWYLNEEFIDKRLECKWYLIKKNVFEESRAVQPSDLNMKYKFPNAILCTYVFFVYWFLKKEILWQYDFVWCSDLDHNGDRIYIGKYTDIDGINKNGFSIHRHLALRNNYATITFS